MTDEERERAYSRGKKYEFLDSTRDISFAFAAGYAAACEDRRAEIEWLMNLLEHYAQDVHREVVTGKLKMGHKDF